MKISPKIINIMNIVLMSGWLFILFLVSVNFLDQINEIIVRFGIFTFIYVILMRYKISFNLEFIVLLTFGTLYFFIYIIYKDYSQWTHIKYWTGAPLMYLIGKSFIGETSEKWFKWAIYTVVFGMFSYGFLSMVSYIEQGITPGTRIAFDFWTGNQVNPTLISIYLIGISSLIIYNLFHLKLVKHLHLKLIHFGALAASAYFIILIAGRTYFIIIALVFILTFILELFSRKLKILVPLIIVSIFIALLYYGYQYDVLGAQTFIKSGRWFIRFSTVLDQSILNDGRFQVYALAKEQFFDFPLGGYQMDLGLTYAHNLWIDVLYAVGLYPFYLLVLYTFLTLITLFKVLMSKYIPKDNKMLIFSVFLGLSLNFMVEPILEGVPYVFYLFCLINGLTYQYLVTRTKMGQKISTIKPL